MPEVTGPLPGVSADDTTRPWRTVTSYVSVLHGAARFVSVPQVARTRDTAPQSEVNAPTEPTGRAYWLRPPSGSRRPSASTDPSRVMRSRRTRRSTPTPKTSSVVVPGGSAGPKRWPSGTADLSVRPLATAGPTEAPVASTPGCWDSVMLKKSPLTPPTAPLASASEETVARPPTASGCSRSTRTRALRRSTLSTWACVSPFAAGMSNSSYVTPGAITVPPPSAPLAGAAPARTVPASAPNAAQAASADL